MITDYAVLSYLKGMKNVLSDEVPTVRRVIVERIGVSGFTSLTVHCFIAATNSFGDEYFVLTPAGVEAMKEVS